MDSVELEHYGNDIVAYDKTLFPEFPNDLFNPEFLSSEPLLQYRHLLPTRVKGRGGLHLFTYHDQSLVLRHYYRGGAVSKFVKDAYLWCGLYKTRAMGELQTLFALQRLDLPAPAPAAARIRRTGLMYRADLVTRFIPKAQPLSMKLSEHPLSANTWRRIGAVIRQFHDKGCNHADLNAHNILLDEKKKVYLIDFDKAVIGRGAGAFQKTNIARLQRSLLKLSNSDSAFHYSDRDFNSLMEGYGPGQC